MTMQVEHGEYARVQAVLDHDLERLWPVIAAFGKADRWVDGVESCGLDGEGVGAVRTLVRNGATVRERLERLDTERREVVYTILEPHSLPARGVRSVISLRRLGPGTTEIIWSSSAESLSAPPEILSTRVEAMYRASLERLDLLAKTAGASS